MRSYTRAVYIRTETSAAFDIFSQQMSDTSPEAIAANAGEAAARTKLIAISVSTTILFILVVVFIIILAKLANGKAARMGLRNNDVPFFWFIGSENRERFMGK